MKPNEVVELIKNKIPITNELDFDIKSWDGSTLTLTAPYEKNKNHHNTVFGGSLAMATVVSGYCMTFMVLDDSLGSSWLKDYTLVIKDFSCNYLNPVSADFETFSNATKEDFEKFIKTLKRKGRARLKVQTSIQSTKKELEASATYVAYRN
jgi:thioesterase domain-containing protein